MHDENARNHGRCDQDASEHDPSDQDEFNAADPTSTARDESEVGATGMNLGEVPCEGWHCDATEEHNVDGAIDFKASDEAGDEHDVAVVNGNAIGDEVEGLDDPDEGEPEADPSVGFAVFYRWRILRGTENRFIRAWEQLTLKLMRERGALGSRLHQIDATTWGAYAQWPSRGAWERSCAMRSVDIGATAIMRDVVTEAFDPIPLEPVCDHLYFGPLRSP